LRSTGWGPKQHAALGELPQVAELLDWTRFAEVTREKLSIFSLLGGVLPLLVLAQACGGSSSETPYPREPEPAAQRPASSGGAGADPATRTDSSK
jgi:hypothetical protein